MMNLSKMHSQISAVNIRTNALRSWSCRASVWGVQGPHLALYLWHLLGELRVCGLREQRVQVLADLLLPLFFVLHLRRTDRAQKHGSDTSSLVCRSAPHLAVNVSQLFSQLCLCGFRQLVIQSAAHLLPAVLLIFHLYKDGGTERKMTQIRRFKLSA